MSETVIMERCAQCGETVIPVENYDINDTWLHWLTLLPWCV